MYEREMTTAVAAVEQACQLCRAVSATLVTAETLAKRDRSPVTVADFGSQAVVGYALSQAFPHDPMVAEEDSAELRGGGGDLTACVAKHVRTVLPALDKDSIVKAIDHGASSGGKIGRFWTLDPIDGTKGFLRGEQYAVALALIEDGVPVLAVLGCPNLSAGPAAPPGVILTAVRGQGVVQRATDGTVSTAVRCSGRGQPEEAVLCESVESAHTAHGASAAIAGRLGVSAPPVRMDSQCKYAVVARGEADVYLRLPTSADYREKLWDHAAGWLLVREAGGKVTDVDGRPLDFSCGRTLLGNRGVVVTNGPLHQAVLAAVQVELGR
jgi:HAL2 family 3'(2'),5'-bisphosphate nucleotidase